MNIDHFEIKKMNSKDLEANFDDFLQLFAENTRGHLINQQIDDNYILNKANQLFEYLQLGKAFVFGLFIQCKLKGFIWSYKRIFLEDERLYINALIINEGYRGKGYGKLLIQTIEDLAIKIGINHVDVSTATFKQEAIHFYQNLGYTPERIQLIKTLQNY